LRYWCVDYFDLLKFDMRNVSESNLLLGDVGDEICVGY